MVWIIQHAAYVCSEMVSPVPMGAGSQYHILDETRLKCGIDLAPTGAAWSGWARTDH